MYLVIVALADGIEAPDPNARIQQTGVSTRNQFITRAFPNRFSGALDGVGGSGFIGQVLYICVYVHTCIYIYVYIYIYT